METEAAKIQIGNPKTSTTFVFLLAETNRFDSAELYMVLELPLFNPAALPDCDRIAKAVAAGLRRGFRGEVNDSNFENALGEINEELAKLTSTGQANWVGKLNCVLAAKTDDKIQVATAGRPVAMMLREAEFVSLSDNGHKPSAQKTFENFATGKLKTGDVFLFSTTNLFNFVTLDKIKEMVKKGSLRTVANKLSESLEEAVPPETTIGTLILNMGINSPAKPEAEEVEMATVIEPTKVRKIVIPKAEVFTKAAGFIARGIKKIKLKKPNFDLTKTSDKLYNITSQTKQFVQSAKIKFPSKQKKIFFISAGVLLLALIVNILITRQYNDTKEETQVVSTELIQMEKLLQEAESTLIYNDTARAKEVLVQFDEKQKSLNPKDTASINKLNELKESFKALKKRIEKNLSAAITELGSIGGGKMLVVLPGILATHPRDIWLTYDAVTGKITEDLIKCPEDIVSGMYWKEQKMFVYNGQNLVICDFATGTTSSPFSSLVPASHEFGGLTYYATSSKLYSVNKTTQEIVSFEIRGDQIYKSAVWSKDSKFANVNSIAVDGSVYTYGEDGVNKFLSASPQEFNNPDLLTPLSGQGQIYTRKDFSQVYILDTLNSRVVITDKKGVLVGTIMDDKLTDLIDFHVDEAKKIIYLLSKDKLFQVKY